MKMDKDSLMVFPLDGPSVQRIENALCLSSSKSIFLEINSETYQLSREGRWFKFSWLTKKNTVKRSAIFQTITEMYNQYVHGQAWQIRQSSV